MLFLEIIDETGKDYPELVTPMDAELLDYLVQLEGFPAFQALGRLDREEETLLGEALRQGLWEELARLSPLVRQRRLPEPPAWIGLEALTDLRLGAEFGWAGLVDFLSHLQKLLVLARTPGSELWAGG